MTTNKNLLYSRGSSIQCSVVTQMGRNPEKRRGRKWQPTPVFSPGKFHGQRSMLGYSPRGHKESGKSKSLTTTTMYMYSCSTLLYGRKEYNIVKQLNLTPTEVNLEKDNYCELAQSKSCNTKPRTFFLTVTKYLIYYRLYELWFQVSYWPNKYSMEALRFMLKYTQENAG